MQQYWRFLFGIITLSSLSACVSHPALTVDLWQSPTPVFTSDTPKAERIVSIALREHKAWDEPFITTEGHIAKYSHYEAENTRLPDGSLVWERVVAYWRDSGALAELDRDLPYHRCNKADRTDNVSSNICRAFVSDVAWSAAFVSYVMKQAGVDFYASPRHFDYIRHSWLGHGDYRVADPLVTPISQGDMLCYVRGSSREMIKDYQGVVNYLMAYSSGLPAHCDIVVKSDESSREVWLVGGNVLHAVMLRKMMRDAQGRVIFAQDSDYPCTPSNEAMCNLNQQNWVLVLKLQ